MLKHKRLLFGGASLLVIFAMIAGAFILTRTSAKAAGNPNTSYGSLTVVGDTAITGSSATTSSSDKNTPLTADKDPKTAKSAKGGQPGLPPPPPQTVLPNPAGRDVTTNNQNFSGFNGISHNDQHNAPPANSQFSSEPPDQGLCVDHGFVVEGVNTAVAVYDTHGKNLTGVESLDQFFKFPPASVNHGPPFGSFFSDPKCIYDSFSGHWFLSTLQWDQDPNTRAATGQSHVYIAVSKTSDPTASWTIFNINTTDDGSNGTPAHTGCPCFGDQPLIGTDAYGFYVTTNEFGLPGFIQATFNGAQVYGISKAKLIAAAKHTAGGNVAFAHINAADYLAPYGGVSYTLQPANRPPSESEGDDASNQNHQHGIEYFLSALQFGNPPYQLLDNRIAVWALTNTSALNSNSPTPNIALHLTVIGSEVYGQPNPAAQKPGPTPLRDAINAEPAATRCAPLATCPPDPIELLNTNDDRMNQVVYAQGNLWSGVNTILGTDGSRTGIAYFKVHPTWSHSGDLQARMADQGYVAVNNESVIFPSIGVNSSGQGVIGFTLVGPDYFPSAAYIRINNGGVVGSVHIAAAGAAPEDGFSGYQGIAGAAPGVARWGDYSAAYAASDGSIWAATEYIPNLPRSVNANWGTFISHVSTESDN